MVEFTFETQRAYRNSGIRKIPRGSMILYIISSGDFKEKL